MAHARTFFFDTNSYSTNVWLHLGENIRLISSAIKVRYSGLMYNEVKFMVSIYIFVCLFVVFFIFMNENKLTS